VQARKLLDGDVGAVARDPANHHEAGEHHEHVASDVEERGGIAGRTERYETDQRVTGVRDARETEQALEVFLDERDQVAVEHRRDREAGEKERDGVIVGRSKRDEAHEHSDRATLGSEAIRPAVSLEAP